MTYNLRYSDYGAPPELVPDPEVWTGPPAPPVAMTVPYVRTSPVHVSRRDLVLGLADSLWLRVTIVEGDWPTAAPITLTGGLGGPALQMLVWPDTYYRTSWDYGAWGYGAWPHCQQSLLWSGQGVVAPDAVGAFDISFPTATMASWPRRCAYALQLDWDNGLGAQLLAEGRLHLSYSAARSVGAPDIMLTDPTPPVLTDDRQDFILLNGTMPI